MAFHGLSIGALTGMGRKGGPFGCQAVHGSLGETVAVDFLQSTAFLDQMQCGLVLMFRSEAGQIQPLSNFLPRARQKLISPSRSAGIALHDHPVGMSGKILKLTASIKDAVAQVSAVLPGAFRKADGVEQGASFGGDGVGRCGPPGNAAR